MASFQARLQLSSPPTSARNSGDPSTIYKEGFILAIYLEDGGVGFGEVAPIEIHKENLQDVEEQLRFLFHVIQGASLTYVLPLLNGSFSSWIWECLGILPGTIYPSVRCGVEMAVLNALAARQNCGFADLLHNDYSNKSQLLQAKDVHTKPHIQICSLINSNAVPKVVAEFASELVNEGFSAIKIKVGRRENPFEDAAVIQEIRNKVGYQVKLRADANRSWTYEQASHFGSSVKHCDLQYIEEPVNSDDDIVRFCEESGLPVALDETIDNIQGDPLSTLAKFKHPGIVAVVIKPSVVGGFENAALIAKWAQMHNKMAVVSSAFESSLGLSAYIQFSYYLEQQSTDICIVKNKEQEESVAHALGTYRWLREDVTSESLRICGRPNNEVVEASIENAVQLNLNFKINPSVVQRSYINEHVQKYHMTVDCGEFSCSFQVLEVGKVEENTVFVFLHGFLGCGEDWIPIMKALSTTARCISIDLPGHGRSIIDGHVQTETRQGRHVSIEAVASILSKLISEITHRRVILIGYSMGARIALYSALRCGNQVSGAVIISGSPGLKDVRMRNRRTTLDEARAKSLRTHGLNFFLETWYSGELWRSLRAHPHFARVMSSRKQHNNAHALANSLSDLSVGRQPSLWDELKQSKKPLLFLYGEKDVKFKEINQQMFHEVGHGSRNGDEIIEIPDSGHAVHLENPLFVIKAISKFLKKIVRDQHPN